MKFFPVLFLTAMLIARADAQQAASTSQHQWVELTLHDGSHVHCDLACAATLYVNNQFAEVKSFEKISPNGDVPLYVFERDPDPVLQKALLDAARSAPERWLPLGESGNFLNASEVAAVYFESDDKGAFARVITRYQSVLQPNVVNDKNPDRQNPNAGFKLRDPAAIERLKNMVKSP